MSKQPRKLVLALVLLLVAFAGVIAKDRQFWFGDDDSQDSDLAQPEVQQQMPARPMTTAVSQTPVVDSPAAQAPAAKKHVVAKASMEPRVADAPVVETTRTVLPPLDVEVVAGDTHRTLHPGTNAAKVEITNPAGANAKSSEFTARLDAPTNAAGLERVTTAATRQPQDASYPLLGQHTNVQGSVILQALISADGVIQDLHVVSGPAILAAAAQQAVRQWRFKPVLENGQAVETKAKITVNFTIKVADNSVQPTPGF